MRTGNVYFSGVQKEISLMYVPEATLGDYVIVHVGFAISVLDEDEALGSLQAFQELAKFSGYTINYVKAFRNPEFTRNIVGKINP